MIKVIVMVRKEMIMVVEDSVVLVIGVVSGMGVVFVWYYIGEGGWVVLVDWDVEVVVVFVVEFGLNLVVVVVDVVDEFDMVVVF